MRDDLGELPPGERLRLRRLALGLSQEEVAERSGLTQPNLSAIESGRRTIGPGVEGRLRAALAERPSVVLHRNRQHILDLASRHGIAGIRVFGSVASGLDNHDSDIDLLVTISDHADPFAPIDFTSELARLLGTPVDVVADHQIGGDRLVEYARETAIPL